MPGEVARETAKFRHVLVGMLGSHIPGMVEATHAPKLGKLPVPIKTKAPKAHMHEILAKT